ncbi:catenin alpha [Paragonimus westermani]|uniref:Catenin alpha n=1 Tax=Paragonimus westermani TaxID=34504 RepID=A0A5J4NLZ3_9TREM|nr:catenin alpha [Paragonimus westermani]
MKAESVLEPLYAKLSLFSNLSIENFDGKSRSKRQHDIMFAIEKFVHSIKDRCGLLPCEIPSLEVDLNVALADVLDTARIFQGSVNSFMCDPMNPDHDVELHRSGSALLSAMSRLLILAELADLSALDDLIVKVQASVKRITAASSTKILEAEWDAFEKQSAQLVEILGKGSTDLLHANLRELYDKTRYILNTNGRLLLSTSRVCLHHPEHMAAQHARDFASKSLSDALDQIRNLFDENKQPATLKLKVSGKLLDEIEEFENSTLIDVDHFDDKRARTQMERHLKGLLPSIYRLADAPQTRPTHQKAVYTHCKQLQLSLGNLLGEYNRQPPDQTALSSAMQYLLNTTGDLKQLLIRIAVDHVTQTLVDKHGPLMALGDATKFGNDRRMDTTCQQFQTHCSCMVAAAYDICALTSNEEVCKSVQLACSQLDQLCPHVISAAYLLFKYPHSRENKENEVQQAAVSMQHRSSHICDVVTRKLDTQTDNLEYVDRVMEKVTLLRNEYTPTFTEVSRDTLSRLAAHQTVDEARFRRAGSNLCTAVHDVRMAVLIETDLPSELELLSVHGRNSQVDDIVTENQLEDHKQSKATSPDKSSTNHLHVDSPDHWVSQENHQSERAELYAMLSRPEKESMAQEMAGFLEEKKRFMREVVRWDDSANEIIVLAKKMCVIMMEMTDFTRGKGPLNSTMEVIQSAQHISELGQRLDQLCRHIADLCPNSASRRDLLAYLQRVTLHCHQLNITGRVKAGVHAARSGVVENSTALIQAARNLMTAVVLTVKESYIASTKFRVHNRQPVVKWQMHAPAKKPLIPSEGHLVSDAHGLDGWSDSEEVNQPDALGELSQFDHMSARGPSEVEF